MDIFREFPESMKLEGPNNYSVWAFRMQQILIRKKVWKHCILQPASGLTSTPQVLLTSPPPVVRPSISPERRASVTGAGRGKNITGGSTSGATSEEIEDSTATTGAGDTSGDGTSHEDITEQRLDALTTIKLSVKDTLIMLVLPFQDPALLWERFRFLYESQSPA
jgi:hypothetical protein